MLSRAINKLKNKDGYSDGVILLGLVIMFFLIMWLVYDRDNANYNWYYENFKDGLSNGVKAALMQKDVTDSSLSKGYVFNESNYNHFIRLNHSKANNIALLMLSLKTGFSIDELKPYIKIVIIEPHRVSPNNYNIKLNMYNNDMKIISNKIYNGPNMINQLINDINSNLENVQIKLVNDLGENILKDIEIKTYYIMIIENFSIHSYIHSDERMINMYYFEGGNLIRSTQMR